MVKLHIENANVGVKSPFSQSLLEEAIVEESAQEQLPFKLTEPLSWSVLPIKKVVRSLAFKTKVLALYDKSCSVCGSRLSTPSGSVAVDAAHIVPRSVGGVDDARNGLSLCKIHHWAFDNGLFGVSSNRTIIVPASVAALGGNGSLKGIVGSKIREASDANLLAHPEAFSWHRENTLIKY